MEPQTIDKDAEIKRLNALCVALENQRNSALNQAANHHADQLVAEDDLRKLKSETKVEEAKIEKPKSQKNSSKAPSASPA